MAKIVIVVEGGVVQDVLTDDTSCEVTLVDYDNFPDAEIPAEFSRLKSAEIIEIKHESII